MDVELACKQIKKNQNIVHIYFFSIVFGLLIVKIYI